jgi:phage terminase large subunit-like protein
MIKELVNYSEAVISGKTPSCLYVRQAGKRFLNDIDQARNKGLVFDEKSAAHVIEFFNRFLKHTKGSEHSGKNFGLQPWQVFRIANIFGWKNDDGSRRFKFSYTEVPRKNGKTTEAAGVVLYASFSDGEPRAECYTAATKRDQASICFDEAVNMVKASQPMRSFLKIYQNKIIDPTTGSTLQPLSSDRDTLDGLNIHCAIIDELHAHKTADVVNVLRTSIGARRQPLIYEITTAGSNKNGVCYNHRDYTTKVLSGAIQDESWFGCIYTLDQGDDWQDPELWIKANPNLEISKSRKYIEDEVLQATNNPAYEPTVLRYDFNIWVTSDERWISDQVWQNQSQKITDEQLSEWLCYAGLDLASTRDTNALALTFINPLTGQLHTKTFFWIPAIKAEERIERELIEWRQWVANGHITELPGNVIDVNLLAEQVVQICKKYKVKTLAYDRAMAYSGTLQHIISSGVNCTEHSQAIMAMSLPTKMVETHILSGRLTHDANPVMAWQISNVWIYRDANDNIKIVKNRSREKVDGPVALVMSMSEMMRHHNQITIDNTLNNVGF